MQKWYQIEIGGGGGGSRGVPQMKSVFPEKRSCGIKTQRKHEI